MEQLTPKPAANGAATLPAGTLRCRDCGSHRLRRSHPTGVVERLLRALTPLRFHRCSDCGNRGRHWSWSVTPAARPRHIDRPLPPARRRERRDNLAARVRRRRIVVSVLVAVALGTLASMMAWPS